MTFPMRGHSLSSQRTFAISEKDLRRESQILRIEYYIELHCKVGAVEEFGKDWLVHDFKNLCKYLKKPGRVREMKRVILKK